VRVLKNRAAHSHLSMRTLLPLWSLSDMVAVSQCSASPRGSPRSDGWRDNGLFP
jgi:hypothetical protein